MAKELFSRTELGGERGDYFGDEIIEKVHADGLYSWIENETLYLPPSAWKSMRRVEIDGRELENGAISQITSDHMEANTLTSIFLYMQTYRINMDQPIPDFIKSRRFTYFLQSDWTGATQFPEAPASAPDTDFLYYWQRVNFATSMGGATTISDVPTSWRNYTGLYRINLERNELSSDQQVGIVNGIVREIQAGLGRNYTATSTTNRIIDFDNGNSGANDVLNQADLVAQGWTITDVDELERFFPDINGVNRRWRVLHNH